MRKAQKQEVLEFISSLYRAHEEIKEALAGRNYGAVQNMLSECQEFAVILGKSIEKLEGEGHITVSHVEEYCEGLFHVFEELRGFLENENSAEGGINQNRILKILNKQLIKIENSVKNDIQVRIEIAFFSYKASMWDSLESVYLAAREDPCCDVYCVPIPYYDLNPDHSFRQMHYEGGEYPEDIEVIDWQTYHFEERKPDVIYFHNPYDQYNLVTSVHPRYYSKNLKKYTECLVYIPYYAISGEMNKAQSMLPAYLHADYIVIQTPKTREYFDKNIEAKKFLPFGSPKFDRIIRKCQNPPEPPREWRERMEGKKVYFYNTSINGMLADTEAFLKKMEYVFRSFIGRNDVCILWRPHPLLESTFDSMRAEYLPVFDALKTYFIENSLGIYDTTPDIEAAIAWSDAYIGDAGTSVVSLFGVVGKPLFILNNQLHSMPREDSWRGEFIGSGFGYFERDKYAITQNNKLYISEPYEYDYKYFCDLAEYAGGGNYHVVREIGDKRYVCPTNARDILVLGEKGIDRKIELKKRDGSRGENFYTSWAYGKYLLLVPFAYPALVKYDTETERIDYLEKNIDVFVKENERGEKIAGGVWVYEGILYAASPTDNFVYRLDIESGESEIIKLPNVNRGGYISMLEKGGSMWMMPYRGQTILRWNPKTGDIREYTGFPEGFQCIHPAHQAPTDEYPFESWAIDGEKIYFTPRWGNMGVKLDTKTGVFTEWELPIPYKQGEEYYYTTAKYSFIWSVEDENRYKLFYWPERKLYDFDIEKNKCKEIEIKFDVEELQLHENGFGVSSQGMKYCCYENSFNSLKDFLDDNITGNSHDREKQIKAYEEIATNIDGSCGMKVHDFVVNRIWHR